MRCRRNKAQIQETARLHSTSRSYEDKARQNGYKASSGKTCRLISITMDKMMMIENKVSTTGSLIIDAATPPSLARTVQGSMNAEIKKQEELKIFQLKSPPLKINYT